MIMKFFLILGKALYKLKLVHDNVPKVLGNLLTFYRKCLWHRESYIFPFLC
jgi:hypothetical protein